MGDLVLDGVVCVVDSRNVQKVSRFTAKLCHTHFSSNYQSNAQQARSTNVKSESITTGIADHPML
jgi:transposase-like protein